MSEPLKVAVAGLGTVGSGVVRILQSNADVLALRTGRPIVLTDVADPDRRFGRSGEPGAPEPATTSGGTKRTWSRRR